MESEVTGDHDSDVIWGVDTMWPGKTVTFSPLNPYPPPLQFQTHAVGAGSKLVALWDDSTGLFDIEEQIDWILLTGKTGTYTDVFEGAGGRYEIGYQVVSTGCAPGTSPCPSNL